MDYSRVHESREASATGKQEWLLVVMEMVKRSRIYKVFLEVELDELSDRLLWELADGRIKDNLRPAQWDG